MATEGSRPMSSSDRNSSSSCPGERAYGPANVKLYSGERPSVNVNIHSIRGSVTVGNKNVITYHNTGGRPQRNVTNTYISGQNGTDSDSDSTSSSDSEAERFFRERGMKKPSRKVFRDLKKTTKTMTTVNKGISTLHIDHNKPPRAYDKYGRQVPFPAPQSTFTFTTSFTTSTTTTGPQPAAANSSARATRSTWAGQPQPAATATRTNPQPPQQPLVPKITMYEQQTQTFNNLMRGIPQPNAVINEAVIRQITPSFGVGWRRVFRHLDMHDAMIDTMHQECGEVKDTVYKLLVKWKGRCETPDLRTLLEAVVRGEQNQVIQPLIQACAFS